TIAGTDRRARIFLRIRPAISIASPARCPPRPATPGASSTIPAPAPPPATPSIFARASRSRTIQPHPQKRARVRKPLVDPALEQRQAVEQRIDLVFAGAKGLQRPGRPRDRHQR